MKLSHELEDFYLSFLKYPFSSSIDLQTFFSKLYNNKDVSKENLKDIRDNLIIIKNHIQYLLDNENTCEKN